MAAAAKKKVDPRVSEIIEAAKAAGADQSYFFETTFARYLRQLQLLDELEKVMDEEEVLVTKEYVKGRKNLYANPAIAQYNSTADAANRTVTTLMRIVATFESAGQDPSDPLLDHIER